MTQEDFGDNIMQSPETERRQLKKRLSNPRQAQAVRKNVGFFSVKGIFGMWGYLIKLFFKGRKG
jgi:hypothetical protein